MSDEYGPWIGWNGGECPVEPETVVQVAFLAVAPPAKDYPAHTWVWGSVGRPHSIIAYRVKLEPVVETVRQAGTITSTGFYWAVLHDQGSQNNGFLVYETRDGIPDMTTLRWEDAK